MQGRSDSSVAKPAGASHAPPVVASVDAVPVKNPQKPVTLLVDAPSKVNTQFLLVKRLGALFQLTIEFCLKFVESQGSFRDESELVVGDDVFIPIYYYLYATKWMYSIGIPPSNHDVQRIDQHWEATRA